MQKLNFSGHESFICRQFWLKKVIDFSIGRYKFSDDTAVVTLGVGKNMVTSLRYWGKAFGMLDEKDNPTAMAQFLFGERGVDQYLEDFGSIWLLHYFLIKSRKASIYSLIINEFRKERIDFTKDHLHSFLKRKCEEVSPNLYNNNTINTDISVFLRNYVKPAKDEKFEVEDDFSGVLIDLELIKQFRQRMDDKITIFYRIESQDRIDLPPQIVLFCILDTFKNQTSISFRDLQSSSDSPGLVFCLNAEGLYNKLLQITQLYPQVVYSETAGNQVLQFKSPLNPQTILHDYYEG